jgi:hypothetical protein
MQQHKNEYETNIKHELKYFYFYKTSEKSAKKKDISQLTPYEYPLLQLTKEERIIAKNLKILLYEADTIEPLSFALKNKNNLYDIIKLLEQLMEKMKCSKRYVQNNYDWSSSLIIQSVKNKFLQKGVPV